APIGREKAQSRWLRWSTVLMIFPRLGWAGECQRMVLDVLRPRRHALGESFIVTSEQGTDRFFITGQVAGQRGQEAIGALLCRLAVSLPTIRAMSFVNEATQR